MGGGESPDAKTPGASFNQALGALVSTAFSPRKTSEQIFFSFTFFRFKPNATGVIGSTPPPRPKKGRSSATTAWYPVTRLSALHLLRRTSVWVKCLNSFFLWESNSDVALRLTPREWAPSRFTSSSSVMVLDQWGPDLWVPLSAACVRWGRWRRGTDTSVLRPINQPVDS